MTVPSDLIVKHRSHLPDHDVNLVADVPTVYHCHHFNLFWDQTIDDALGSDLSTVIRTQAAREGYYDLLAQLAAKENLQGPDQIIELAESVFGAVGQGKLHFELTPREGRSDGSSLHYSHAWMDKYSERLKRSTPADAVAAGYSAAVHELAYGISRESTRSREVSCIARGDSSCLFALHPGDPAPSPNPVVRADIERVAKHRSSGLYEEEIAGIAAGLRDFTAGVLGDERGLIQAFGLFITQHPTTYYNRSGYDAYRNVQRATPHSAPVMRALMREAGHVCVFNTFGSILQSPEWEGLVGPLRGDVEEIVIGCSAIGRALGMGRWSIQELVPGERLVLRNSATYESLYYMNREPRAQEPRCFFYEGAALATMQLATRVPWRTKPTLNGDFYDELFRRGLPWQSEEHRCMSRGDPYCEVVVTRNEGLRDNQLPVR